MTFWTLIDKHWNDVCAGLGLAGLLIFFAVIVWIGSRD